MAEARRLKGFAEAADQEDELNTANTTAGEGPSFRLRSSSFGGQAGHPLPILLQRNRIKGWGEGWGEGNFLLHPADCTRFLLRVKYAG